MKRLALLVGTSEYPECEKIIEEKELNWLIQKIVIKSLNIKSEEKDDLNYE